VISGRRIHAVIVLNLSTRGAMASGGRMPRAGENIILQLEDLSLAATVMWTRWPRYGLLFRDLLSQERVDKLAQVGGESS
jgi:hypothetical protein